MNLLSKTLFLATLLFSGLAAAAAPNISISDVTTTEGNSGAKAVVFTVSLSAPSTSNVGFMFGTAEVNAVGNDDFQHAYSSPRTIPAGETSQTFEVYIYGDTVVEADETFQVLLENVTNATVLKGVGVGTIVNDDSGASATLLIGDVSISEGNSGSKTANFTVQLSKAAAGAVSFSIASANGTATSGSDYTAISLSNQSIPAGQLYKSFSVSISGDTTAETDETFMVNLSNASGASIGRGQAVSTILNDDNVSPVKLSVWDLNIAEGNSGTKIATFTVGLSQAATSTVTFDIKTEDSSATAGSDYVAKALTGQSIAVGQTSKTFTVTVNGDTTPESDERFLATVSNVVNAAIEYADNHGVATIPNDDAAIFIGDVSKLEGDSGDSFFTFPVTLSAPLASTIQFKALTCDGTAKASEGDYWTLSDLFYTQIPAGQTTVNVNVSVQGDFQVEGDETFCVDLTEVSGVAVGDSHAVGTILNDDLPPPTVSVAAGSAAEGNTSVQALSFPITLSHAAQQSVTIYFHTTSTGGTATANVDYSATSGSIQVPAGLTSFTYEVGVYGDTTVEPNETFSLVLDSADGAVIGANASAVGTILNDDDGVTPPDLTIDDVAITEGNSGTKTANFTVSLSHAFSQDVTFLVTTGNRTADNVDYVPLDHVSRSIPAGQTSGTVSITINGDTTIEPDEYFDVYLNSVSNAVPVDATGAGTISNDDAATGATLSIADVSIAEGNSGTKTATFTVMLSQPVSGPVLFDIATANGSATAGSDYVAKATNGLRIAAGQTSKTFAVTINGDTTSEPDETFTVNLANATGATIGDGQAVGTITNDDAAANPTLSMADLSVAEGNSGTSPAVVTISLSAPAPGPVSFEIDTYPNGGGADADTDYVSRSASVVIPTGATSTTFEVAIIGDIVAEPTESLGIRVSHVSGALVPKDWSTVTITDVDTFVPPEISINDVLLVEGDAGTKTAVFTVSLSNAVSLPVGFDLATSDGSAVAGSDYVALAQPGLVFAPGETSKTFAVTINGDTAVETDEYFSVDLSNVSNAIAWDTHGVGTVMNDDGLTPPVLSLDFETGADESSPPHPGGMAFASVQLSKASPYPVTFDLATADGTAQAGSDYVVMSQTAVTIPPGQLSSGFMVQFVPDSTYEADEVFYVNVSNVSGATVGNASTAISIRNDDAGGPALSIGDVSIAEGNSGTKLATFTVSLAAPAITPVSFVVGTVDGTATAGSDYVAFNAGGFQIPVGQSSTTFQVTINGDTAVESDETFTVNLTFVSGATIGDGSAVATITNDDAASGPTLSIADVSIAEGNSGTKTATFTVSLSQSVSGPVLVNVATANGSATAGSDYVAKTTNGLRIAAGQTSKTFLVTINGDTAMESNETFTVNLSNASGAVIGNGQAVGTITNDDSVATPTLTIADASVSEGNSGTKVLTFTVSLSPATAGTVSYDIATSNGTATSGSDYVASSLVGQTIASGATSKTFAVTINGDTTAETDETFTVTLSNVSGATLGDGSAIGTITNDDSGGGSPTLSIADVSIAEGQLGSKSATFTVSLSAAASAAVTYTIATADGTAISPADYTAKSMTGQSIPAGTLSKTFVVAIKGDKVAEPNETFTVNLSAVTGATVADGQAIGTITNDDAAALSIARFDARGLVDDIDDGNRAPQVSAGEYALLLLDSAQGICARTGAASIVAVEGIENRAVLADLAETANASCAQKPRYAAAMAPGDDRGFLVEVPATTDARGVQVLGAPTLDAASKLTSLQVLGSGHAGPITLLLPQAMPTSAAARTQQLRALGNFVQAQLKAEPQARVVLIGGVTVPGLLDLTARSLPAKSTLPAERVLVSPALLDEFGRTKVVFPVLPATEPPSQVLQLQR